MVAEEEAGVASSDGPTPGAAPTEPAPPVVPRQLQSRIPTLLRLPSPRPSTRDPRAQTSPAWNGEEGRDQEDEQLEQEMEADEGESDDEEMKGLAEEHCFGFLLLGRQLGTRGRRRPRRGR
jgi:hypothetical protein